MEINANGIRMSYEWSGKKDGPVVLLSHSLGSSLVMWELQRHALEPHFRVLSYNTRGHGGSEATPGGYTMALLEEDVLSLLDALGIDQVHWVGLSMGGMIGQCVALRSPQRLRSLALCDTAAATSEDAQPLWQERIDTARRRGMSGLLQATLERWFTPSFLEQNPRALTRIREQFLATPIEGFIGCSEAIRRLNILDRLGEIELPTLIMVGELDPATPVAASQAMQEKIRNSRLVILPSAAHFSNVEQAERFNAALLTFLKDL